RTKCIRRLRGALAANGRSPRPQGRAGAPVRPGGAGDRWDLPRDGDGVPPAGDPHPGLVRVLAAEDDLVLAGRGPGAPAPFGQPALPGHREVGVPGPGSRVIGDDPVLFALDPDPPGDVAGGADGQDRPAGAVGDPLRTRLRLVEGRGLALLAPAADLAEAG